MESGLKLYFLLMGFSLLALGFVLFYRRFVAWKKGATAVGRVVGHQLRTMDDSTIYLPIIVFFDQQGKEFRFTSVAGGSVQNPKIGTEVRVCYLRSNPEIAYINSFLHMWAAPVACAILGLAAFAAIWV
jgi:Protein of unknown function (DUF3592)